MNKPACEAACDAEGGSMLCISSLEENDAVFASFEATRPREPRGATPASSAPPRLS